MALKANSLYVYSSPSIKTLKCYWLQVLQYSVAAVVCCMPGKDESCEAFANSC